MGKLKRMHLIVKGRVQGVFFRSNAEKMALKLGLKGYVKNTNSGDVEIVAEGSKKMLDELMKWCRTGPIIAHVDTVDVECGDVTGEFETFSIKY